MTRLDRVQNLLNSHMEFESRQGKEMSNEAQALRTKNWTTLYRRNWDIYAEKELEIPIKIFQQIIIYLIGISDVFFLFCSRGLSKKICIR